MQTATESQLDLLVSQLVGAAALPAPDTAEEDDKSYLDRRPLLKELMASTPGIATYNPDRVIQYVSATHVNDHQRCAKRCYGARVLGLKSPKTPSLQLGTDIHKVIEDYGNGVAMPDRTTHAGRVAIAGEQLLPDPERVAAGKVSLEHEFVYPVPGLPVPFYGLIDVLDYELPGLEDHKSCSSYKYVLNEYELRTNPQVVIYGNYTLSLGISARSPLNRDYIFAQFNYFRTISPQAMPVKAKLYADDLAKQLLVIIEDANAIIRNAQLPFEQVPHNTNACSDYRGCHMQNLCVQCGVDVPGKLPSSLYTALLANQPYPQEFNSMATLPPALQKLKDARAAAQADATPLNDVKKDENNGFETAAAPSTPASVAPTPAAPTKPKFGVPVASAPAPAPVATNVAAKVAMSINPPDGVGPAATVLPEMPQAAATATQDEVEARAAGEQLAKEEAKAAQKAAKEALKPVKGGLPGKKKAEEPKADAIDPELMAFIVADIKRVDADRVLQEAIGIKRDLDAQTQGVKDEAQLLLDNGQEDEADELTAQHNKAVTKADRAYTKAYEAFKAADAEALAQAVQELAQRQADALVAANPGISDEQLVLALENGPQGQHGAPAGRTLYINCRPQRAGVVLWEDFIAPYIARAEKTKCTPYFRMLQFDANTAVITELLADIRSGKVALPQALVMLNFGTGTHGQFREALVPMYAHPHEIVQ